MGDFVRKNGDFIRWLLLMAFYQCYIALPYRCIRL